MNGENGKNAKTNTRDGRLCGFLVFLFSRFSRFSCFLATRADVIVTFRATKRENAKTRRRENRENAKTAKFKGFWFSSFLVFLFSRFRMVHRFGHDALFMCLAQLDDTIYVYIPVMSSPIKGCARARVTVCAYVYVRRCILCYVCMYV